MKIRTRITAFVVASGLLASLLLSVWLIYELLEQPFRILDTSLYEESERAVRALANEGGGPLERAEDLDVIPAIWLQISGVEDGRILYRSSLARSLDLNSVKAEKGDIDWTDIVETIVGSAFRKFRGSPSGIYRVIEPEIESGGRVFRVQAARSMDKLDEEIREIFWVVVSSLILVTLVLIAAGRFIAGKIVRPIEAIRLLAQNIGDRNLAQRIPAGTEQDELSDLAQTLNDMLDRLHYSFARQKEFLFDTSHELKTPLTTIRLAMENLRPGGRPLPPDAARENLCRLENQILRMERLVKDLLNLSSLETRQDIDTGTFDLSSMLRSLAEEYRILAEAREIEIAVAVPEEIEFRGDKEKLFRAFSNIIDNAVKYNVRGGRVGIEAAYLSGSLKIEVENTGEGLAQEESARVFEQFYRGEKSRSAEKGGAGLGLAIVKKIVELHRGTVSFESRKEGPSKLTLLLPLGTRTE